MNKNWRDETICQHLAEDYRFEGAVVAPIFQNSLFVHLEAEKFHNRQNDPTRFDYTRVANPTTDIAEQKIAALEKTDKCRLFTSGMAAITAAIMSCTKAGDHIVCTSFAYGPTKQFLTDYFPRFGVTTTFVDGTNLNAIEEAIQPNTTLIFLESPGTFYFQIQDLEAISALAKSRGISTIIDNSNASPIFQNPHAFGIDLVAHTVTKYLGGHSDIVAGAICGSQDRMHKLIHNEGVLLGANMDPFAAWLLTRSLRTLSIRMERHQQSAIKVANYLENHPNVERVWYPGLASHPGQELIKKQMRGTSGLLSFEPKKQTKEFAFQFCDNLKLFQMGPSWGGHESLAIPLYDPDRDKWFFRLSIGLENVEDLLEELDRELAKGG